MNVIFVGWIWHEAKPFLAFRKKLLNRDLNITLLKSIRSRIEKYCIEFQHQLHWASIFDISYHSFQLYHYLLLVEAKNYAIVARKCKCFISEDYIMVSIIILYLYFQRELVFIYYGWHRNGFWHDNDNYDNY